MSIKLERNGRISAIKARQGELGMADEAYRIMLRRVSLKAVGRAIDSCADMPLKGLYAVLDEMRRMGGENVPAPAYPGKPTKWRNGCGDLVGKIEAQLTDMKLPWQYARAILKRTSAQGQAVGTDRIEWATAKQLGKVVAALDYEQEKRHLADTVRDELKASGYTEADIPRLLPSESGVHLDKWDRNKRVMLRLRAALAARRAAAAHDAMEG